MAKWEELPITDRAQYMRLAVQNGYRDIRTIREAYNIYAEGGTKGGPEDEYEDWLRKEAKLNSKIWGVSYKEALEHMENDRSYDYRKFYELQKANPNNLEYQRDLEGNAHYNDVGKSVYHPTASIYSYYSDRKDPKWNPTGAKFGEWVDNNHEYRLSDDMLKAGANPYETFDYMGNEEDKGVALRNESGRMFRDYRDQEETYLDRTLPTVTVRPNSYENGGFINLYSTGHRYTESSECAYFSNHTLNDHGYMMSGNAWTPRGGDIIFNGFDELEKPDTYDEASYDKYALDAADNVFNHFNTRKTLDPNKVYTVNMYHASSKKKERAFNEGDSVYGTHTGYLNYEPNTDTWYVTHNIDGVIHKDRFGDLQRKGNTNRVTAIFEPRKNTILNRTLTWLGFANGGILNTLASP